MDNLMIVCILLPLTLYGLCGKTVTTGLEHSFMEDKDKIDLRRDLDRITQELLVKKDPFYHSYVFNSGVGNREKLLVEWMRQETQFIAGEGVVSWQAVRNIEAVHLVGRKMASITLETAAVLLSPNRSAKFHEHSINFEANVTSTSLFLRWNPATSRPEVIVVVAIDTSAADILFYRVVNERLEYITQWSRYRRVSCLTAVSVDGKNQLIVTDAGSPASVDVFDIVFTPDRGKLDFRLMQSFPVTGESRSTSVCRVGGDHYLILPLPQHLAVYRLVSGHYQKHKELALSGVSQVVCFNVALQTYLAINGEMAHVLRLNQRGEFVSELRPGFVSEWLVLPVSSYRIDVLLLSRATNLTKAYVWAGANKGFEAVTMPQCDLCLEGDWSGAVSVPFQHQNCLLIPQSQGSSRLVLLGTSLYNNNPVLNKLKATIEKMKTYQDKWQRLKSRIAEMEQTLRFTLKQDDENVITGKWKIGKLEGPRLRLSSFVQPQNETKMAEEASEALEREEELLEVERVQSAVHSVMAEGKDLIKAVRQREKEAWGLDGFQGRITFKGKLTVNNLTVSTLNHEPMDQFLHNTFRKDKPKSIQQAVVVEKLEAEDIAFKRINNFTSDRLKFSDGPVIISGNVTFERPLVIKGGVEFQNGGGLNGVNLSKELCNGQERCSVYPALNINEIEAGDRPLNNNIEGSPETEHFWSKTVAGRNLTVLKINGVDWQTLSQNVVYKDASQNITGTVVVKGKVSAEPVIWADSTQYLTMSLSRASDSNMSSPLLRAPPSEMKPASASSVLQHMDDELSVDSELIVSELEVTGTVICVESEWGAEAADVVLSGTNPIVIEGEKTFSGAVNVTNNAEVEGRVGGVVVSDLFTKDSEQVFYGPTTLHGNITLGNFTLTGLFNGERLTGVLKGNSNRDMSGGEVTAESVHVLETINGVPVSELVFTGDDDVTTVKTVKVDKLYVTDNILVSGKMCDFNLDDFNQRRLSLAKKQNISGNFLINKAKITTGFRVEKLNGVELSAAIDNTDDSENEEILHLSELHVDGDIVTSGGVNGYNISEVAADAVWLEGNNDEIEGPLMFKDEISFYILECKGFWSNKGCDSWLDVNNMVFKNNKSVTFSGKKSFKNLLNISEDLTVQEINGHKIEDILTKTTEQEIAGDLIVSGDVRVTEDTTIVGLLNGQNITELGHRCSLMGNTITCKGDAVFKDEVLVEHFKTSGRMNNIKFDSFLKSVIRIDEPQPISGLKNFTGNVVTVESIVGVDRINGKSWDDFLSDSVTVGGQESVDHAVTFTEPLSVRELSVDYNMDADTFNGINISEWRTDSIYINESQTIGRELRFDRVSSKGNLSVMTYGGLDLEHDVVRLHSPSRLPFLRAKAVTVLGDVEVMGLVNGRVLAEDEQNSLKMSGDQTMSSDMIVTSGLVIDGNFDIWGTVNQRNLSDIVTLTSDQTLHGKYEFDCVEALGNVSALGLISGINLTTWMQTGVVKGGREQEISGVWRVQGELELLGPVVGEGRLATVDLKQLTANITRDILEVHHQMKSNLSEACEEANTLLRSARSQHSKLQHLDVIQNLPVPSGTSLVAHFKNGEEDFLAVSENGCVTNIYKWNRHTGLFSSLHRQELGFALKNFIILSYKHFIYILTESSEIHSDCKYNGKNLWIFMEDHFKHISSVNFFSGDLFQGEGNTMYVVNESGMFKNTLQFDEEEGKASIQSTRHHWNITTDFPKEWSRAAQYAWFSDVYRYSNCSGDVVSVAVDPGQQFVAVASTESAQVPRHVDFIKVYRQNGQLFDKLPVQQVNQLQWLSVPAQTWLVALQNHSSLNLYQLQGPLLGFQLQVSAPTDANKITTVALPLTAKVNPQPHIIMQSPAAVNIVRAFVQGDPYLGTDLTCSFDRVLSRIPRT